MGYRLVYGPAKQRKDSQRNKLSFLGWTLGFFVLFWTAAWHFIPEEISALCDYLLPRSQIGNLVNNLQSGDTITDAIDAFCEDLLHGS